MVLTLCSLGPYALRVARSAEELPKRSGVTGEEYIMRTMGGAVYFHRFDLDMCRKMLAWWRESPACERLAMAEGLLESMMAEEEADVEGYERKPGAEDLSLPVGRAKWALEQLLRGMLPGVVDRKFRHEELKKLHAQATLLVEAYRQGVIAAAAHHDISPAHFARLKRQFKGKVGPEAMDEQHAIMALDRLFWEWPPIGRRYEDLVSIIGVKGENQDYGVRYMFRGDYSGAWYRLVIKDGVIWSVQKRRLE